MSDKQDKIVDIEKVMEGMSNLPEESRRKLRDGKEVMVVVVIEHDNEILVMDTTGQGGSNMLSMAVAMGKVARGAQVAAQQFAKALSRDEGRDVAEAFLSAFFDAMTVESGESCAKMRTSMKPSAPEAKKREPLK